MMGTQETIAVALAFAVACVVPRLLARSAWSQRVADVPNARSLHEVPTPRVGGIGIVAGALPVAAWLGGAALLPLIACAACLAAISFLDDVRSLPVQVRLPAHFVAALIAVLTLSHGASDALAWSALAAAVIAIVWATNLFNFMDGADGLAGGMAAIGFGAYAIAAHRTDPALSLAAMALAAASAGFLTLNFPPARVFMGDAGSIPLGFLAGALGYAGIAGGAWPPWFPVLAFSPFVLDATLTLARRAWKRERVWRAHRSHYYQRLVLVGWSHRRLACSAYVLMLAAAASALWALGQGRFERYAIIAVWAATYAMLFIAIDRRARLNGAG